RVCCHDNTFPPQKEDRLLRHPDVFAVYHDRDPVPGVLLAEQGICPCQNCV
ncbi:hypothetical protein M9458_041303, partial [Cirrhinus mrigala]